MRNFLYSKKLFQFFLITIFLFAQTLFAQNEKNYQLSCIAFYNLENLFDTINQENVRDEEFTPEGLSKWTYEKYQEKLDKLSEVISQIGTDVSPDGAAIVGVSEIENRGVLEDLVNTPKLKPFNYKIVHYDSPDKRGVDVALLYQPKYFKVTGTKSYTLKIDGMDDFYTRDQLLVSGIFNGEQFYFIVNHWPSRRGGEKRSKPLRNAAADLNRRIVDSLLVIDKNAKIIVMGDLNDNPVNESVKDHLRAKAYTENLQEGDLHNPMGKLYKKGIGSSAWRDSWSLFDQIIISQALLGDDYSDYKFYKAKVFNKKFLVQKEGRYKGYPFRTFAGGVYLNGYSDHFPVYIFIVKQVEK